MSNLQRIRNYYQRCITERELLLLVFNKKLSIVNWWSWFFRHSDWEIKFVLINNEQNFITNRRVVSKSDLLQRPMSAVIDNDYKNTQGTVRQSSLWNLNVYVKIDEVKDFEFSIRKILNKRSNRWQRCWIKNKLSGWTDLSINIKW